MLRRGAAAAAPRLRAALAVLAAAPQRSVWSFAPSGAAPHAPPPPDDALFDVLRLAPGGGDPTLLSGRSAASLGLAPRDAPLFRRAHFCAPPATLTWRGDALYVRLEPYKAILRASDALLFDAHRGAVASAAREAAAATAGGATPPEEHPLPFALAVLETLLSAAAAHARSRLARLCAAADAALADVSAATAPVTAAGALAAATASAAAAAPSGEAFARLVPLTRALAALASDVAEVQEALTALSQDAPALAALSGGPAADPTAAAALVGAYLRQVRAVAGELRELRQHIGATREVWELQLDGTRNRLHRLELHANFAVLSLALASVPAAFLGMNVPTGLEAAPGAFPAVLACAAAAGGTAYAAGARWARAAGRTGRAAAAEGAAAARAMSAVLASLDDIEDALRAGGGGLSRPQLLAALRATCPGRFGADPDAELALIFRIFDHDSDGCITLKEWAPHGGTGGAHPAEQQH